MKKKQTNCVVNNQEDEDGFSINPYDVFIYNNTNGNQEYNSIGNTTNSESDSAETIMTSSKENRYGNKINHFQNV